MKERGALEQEYVCTGCGYVYRPEAGDPQSGVMAGTPFMQITDYWFCPKCDGVKSAFVVKT